MTGGSVQKTTERHSGQPRIMVRGSATRNPGVSKSSGFPKFTNEVQHFLYKVLRWDKNMNSFRWNNVARLPGIAKPGKQSAKSRQLWIARHRLERVNSNATVALKWAISRSMLN